MTWTTPSTGTPRNVRIALQEVLDLGHAAAAHFGAGASALELRLWLFHETSYTYDICGKLTDRLAGARNADYVRLPRSGDG